MDENLDAFGRDAEEPAGFHHLESFVHERRRVNSYLGSHAPCGVLQRVGGRNLLQLFMGKLAERAARTGEQNLVYRVYVFTDKALEYGAVLGIDGQ